MTRGVGRPLGSAAGLDEESNLVASGGSMPGPHFFPGDVCWRRPVRQTLGRRAAEVLPMLTKWLQFGRGVSG